MSLLKNSVLFTNANELYIRLLYLSNQGIGKQFDILFKEIQQIYNLPNTRDNREKLKKFTELYKNEVYKKYAEVTTDLHRYNLKDDNDATRD